MYVTQNSTTHHADEIPETLAALQKADAMGMGKRKLLPISDPYANGQTTYDYAFGDETPKMDWWHADKNLREGQVRVGEDVLTLGTDDPGASQDEMMKISDDWRKLLIATGLKESKADEVIAALMRDPSGNAKLTASGVGASNELVQMISAFNRAESGEFDIESLVLSGHHYSGTDYLFGEKGDHEYDLNDSLNFKDIEALRDVFPKAYAGVKSVQFSACNTHDIGMQDEAGESVSTNEWLSNTFENVESASYWEGIAPGPETAAFWSGEFQLDTARKRKGDQTAFDDAYWRSTQRGAAKRSERDANGEMSEIPVAKNTKSYTYNDYKGYRGTTGESFHKRPDLMKYVVK
jgi:hypothetical protein